MDTVSLACSAVRLFCYDNVQPTTK